MRQSLSTPASFDQVAFAAAQDAIAALQTAIQSVPTIIFTGLVDNLPAPSAANVGKYARVSDLFGEKTDLVLCSLYGTTYFWQPVRPVYTNTSAMTADVNRTLTPLKSPSILILTGTLTGSKVQTLSKVGAWPGLTYEIQMTGVLGIYTLTIAGLAAGATLSLLLNTTKRFVYDGTDYQILN